MLLRFLLVAALVAMLAPAAPADEKLVQKVYPVADLVIPIPEPTGTDATRPDASRVPAATCEAALMKLIRTVVAPRTWQEAGGAATADYYPVGLSLVVRQTAEAHEQIAQLLDGLRRLQDSQVVFEVRFVRVSQAAFEQLRAGQDGCPPDGPASACLQCGSLAEQLAAARWHPQQAVLLNDAQVRKLLEAVRADPSANVMQMPKLTTFEGQRAIVRTGETRPFLTGTQEKEVNGRVVQVPARAPEFIGTQLTMQGVATPDRKHVCVHVRAALSAADPLVPVTSFVTPVFEGGAQGQPIPFTQFLRQPTISSLNVQTTVIVPDGGTVMIGGLKTLSEGRNEFGPPVLSQVPYVNRLFKNVGPACAETSADAAPCTGLIEKPQIQRLAVEKTLAIPDGGTALVDCGNFLVTERNEYGPPVLSEVPYVNRLFKNVGYGRTDCRILMLVTPRLLRGAEACQAGALGSGTGKLLVGAGVNSDAGLCGSVVMNERNFNCYPATGCVPAAERPCGGRAVAGKGGACGQAVFAETQGECCAANACCAKGAVGEPGGCCKGPFSLAEVVQLAAAKVSDEVIINQILTTGSCYTLDARAILWLKAHGVSDAVVIQMQGTRPKADAPATPAAGLNVAPTLATCPQSAVTNSISDEIVDGLLQVATFCAPTLGLLPPGVLVNVYNSDPASPRMPLLNDPDRPSPSQMERPSFNRPIGSTH